MDENKTFAAEQAAGNVEQTTEETPKMYTEAERQAYANEVSGKRAARKEAKLRKEYDRTYGDLVEVLRAGMGKEDISEITSDLREFYSTKKGIKIPQKPVYSQQDIEVLAKGDAEEIIRGGFEEVVEEVDRLTQLGVSNMTEREKAVFQTLATHRQNTERIMELTEMGVTEDVYNSQEFKDFTGQFTANIPIRKIYDMYAKMQPQKEHKTAGSMKNTNSGEGAIKDFYTPEEAKRFSKSDLDKNPALYEAIVKSMAKWK